MLSTLKIELTIRSSNKYHDLHSYSEICMRFKFGQTSNTTVKMIASCYRCNYKVTTILKGP